MVLPIHDPSKYTKMSSRVFTFYRLHIVRSPEELHQQFELYSCNHVKHFPNSRSIVVGFLCRRIENKNDKRSRWRRPKKHSYMYSRAVGFPICNLLVQHDCIYFRLIDSIRRYREKRTTGTPPSLGVIHPSANIRAQFY